MPERFQVLHIEADIEEGEEGVDELKHDQLHCHMNIMLFLGPEEQV
jgi:hypothetical protein